MGFSGLVRLQTGGDQQGLSFSLSPSYGSGYRDASSMWGHRLFASNNSQDDAGQGGASAWMNIHIGYGVSASGGRGLLTPYSEATLGETNRYRLGIRWKRNSWLDMDLFGKREQKGGNRDDNTILLESPHTVLVDCDVGANDYSP